MRTALITTGLLASLYGSAAAAMDPGAQEVLDQGHWGLITQNLSDEAVALARSCEGPWISFAFSETEVQLISHEGKTPPTAPPQVFAATEVERDTRSTIVKLFTAEGDKKPAAVFTYDASVKSLMAMGEDGDGTDLYALCE